MLIPRSILKMSSCAARERSRYAMDGLHIERDRTGTVTCVATDGKRLVSATLAPNRIPSEASELATVFACPEARPGHDFSVTIPLADTLDKKGNVTAQGLLSLVRDERKKKTALPISLAPVKPVRESFYPRPKRPKLGKLPKRAAFVAETDETRESVQMRYLTARTEAKAHRTELMAAWRMQVSAASEANAAIKAKHIAALATWRQARKDARKALAVFALDLTRADRPIGVAVAPGRVRELDPVDGHFPPYRDVMPKMNRPHSHELIVDPKALELIANAWRAQALADERATLGEQAGDVSACDVMRLELEGFNAVISGPNKAMLSDVCRDALASFVTVASGEGRCTIGFNPFFLAEMAEALHAAIGSSGSRVRIGIKSAQDAIIVAPVVRDVTGFDVTSNGVSVSGVLMPINLA